MNKGLIREINEFRPGVLSSEQIQDLIKAEIITGYTENSVSIGLSSLDLHLGDKIWEMRGGIKGNKESRYNEILKSSKYHKEIGDISNGFELKYGKTYVIELQEKVRFSEKLNLYGNATGKSTIGRLDTLTRLIADYSDHYDELPYPNIYREKDGEINLYIEITPITFNIKVKKGSKLNQLRFYSGSPSLSLLTKEHYNHFGELLKGGPNNTEISYNYLSVELTPIDIKGGQIVSAFKALNNINCAIDIDAPEHTYSPEEFWEPMLCKEQALLIKKEAFYIIRSKEKLHLPEDVAVYGQAMTENLGELRIHYAGFAHPCFGYFHEGGIPLIFEIRGHNVDTFLRDGERIARIKYYRMSKQLKNLENLKKEAKKEDYQKQDQFLSKIFKKWGE
ncbi:2'-deoxycytidine 5'-triphosphate deaminase [bacterium]|nr:2'-deoxycytidine 5'-triphosphate deaminase [bacterium]